MTGGTIRVLEAAVEALRERNAILETDRGLLGARVVELEDKLVRLQRELDQRRPPARRPAVRSVLGRGSRALSRLAGVAGRRRRRAGR
jgi:hypothetical protein